MLQNLRDYLPKWFSWVLLGLFSTFIAGTGLNLYSGRSSTVLAKVNRKAITYQQLQRQYALFKLSNPSQEKLKPELEEALLRRLLEQLIFTEVLYQNAKRYHYRIHPEAILEHLQQTQLNVDKKLLRATGHTLESFLKEIEKASLPEQLSDAILNSAFVLEKENQGQIQLLNQRRDFSYLTIKPERFLPNPNTFDDTTLKNYYQQHIEAFHAPEQASIEYLVLEVSSDTNQTKESNHKAVALQQFGQKVQQLAQLGRVETLEKIAQQLNLELETSSLITPDAGKDEITEHSGVRQAIFDSQFLKVKGNRLVPISNSKVVLLRIKEYRPLRVLPFESILEQVREHYMKSVAQQALHTHGAQILRKLKEGNTDVGLKWHVVKQSTRDNTSVPRFINELAFKMPPRVSSSNIQGIESPSGDYIILKLDGVYPGVEKPEDPHSIRQEHVLQMMGQLDYLDYMQTCIKNAKYETFI